MQYYAAPWVGNGTDDDRFRPPTEQSMTAIDWRGDCMVRDGWSLLSVAEIEDAIVKAGGRYLGDDLEDPAGGDLLMKALGLRYTGLRRPTIKEAVLDLFYEHSTRDDDRTKVNRLRPVKDASGIQRVEVRLGGVPILDFPIPSGGATITESFDTANSTTLGPDLSWTEVTGNAGVTSNQAENYSAAAGRMKATTDLSTSDNYAQAVLKTPSGGSLYYVDCGVICRYSGSAGTDTGYLAWLDSNIGPQDHIDKIVTGTRTTLADLNFPSGSGGTVDDVWKVSAVGSTIAFAVNGTQVLSVTDTAITTGTRCGFQLRHTSAANRAAIDNFEAGDIATTPGIGPIRKFVSRQVPYVRSPGAFARGV